MKRKTPSLHKAFGEPSLSWEVAMKCDLFMGSSWEVLRKCLGRPCEGPVWPRPLARPESVRLGLAFFNSFGSSDQRVLAIDVDKTFRIGRLGCWS